MESEEDISGLGKPLPIRLSRIERFEDQPRRFFDLTALAELAESIKLFGQKTPVKVCKHATKPGAFVLIGGERRWRAFHILQEKSGQEPVVNAFVDTVRNHEEHFREALLDNLLREDICPVDEAASYAKLIEQGMSTAEVAKMVQKSVTHIDGYLKLNRLPEKVKKLMDAGLPKRERLQTTIAIEIARSTNDPVLATELAQESVERELGVMEARSLITARVPAASFQNRPGRARKASDNYAVFLHFINGTNKFAKLHLGNLDIAGLYDTRDNDEEDRSRDASAIRGAIKSLEDMLRQVEETPIARFKRTGS